MSGRIAKQQSYVVLPEASVNRDTQGWNGIMGKLGTLTFQLTLLAIEDRQSLFACSIQLANQVISNQGSSQTTSEAFALFEI